MKPILLTLLLATAACSTSTSTDDADAAAVTDVPQTLSGFEDLCDGQASFPGVAPYEAGPGPHPIVVFEALDGSSYTRTRAELPAGWLNGGELTGTDADIEQFMLIELVACVDISQKTDSGFECELQTFDGEPVTIEPMDVLFDMNVYEAATGALVRSMPIRSRIRECPRSVLLNEGQTDYVVGPTADDYEELLRPTVDPR